MSSSAYIGRVGGLAVALGIGTAIATGQGIAAADSLEQPGSPGAPESPPDANQHAADGPAAVAPGMSIDFNGLSLPSIRLWDRQTRRGSLADRVEARRKLNMTAEAESNPTAGTDVPDNSIVGNDESGALQRAASDSVMKPKGRSETSDEAAVVPANPFRSSVASRHLIPDIVEHTADQFASVTHTVRRVIDKARDTITPTESVAFVQAQLPASSRQALSTTALAAVPVIASAAPAAPQTPSIVTRLLAPLGIGAMATTSDTPVAPASPTTLMGALELVRRELERIFVNKTPSFTYVSTSDFTGKVTPVDADGTDFTYTATSPADGHVDVDPDGNVTFTPNANYNPVTGTSFAVTVSDAASDFHVHGLPGLLNLVTFGLVGESGHTHTEIVTVGGAMSPSDFQRTTYVSGLNQPTDFRFLPQIDPSDPDERQRILFVEKGGAVKVYNGTQMQSQPVMTLPVATNWARGINGVEVDPDFNSNGFIYVSYIGTDNIERLSRFTVTDPTADVLTADPGSEQVLLAGDEPAGDDHHGGEIRYIDGKLYWATGDNVCCSVVDGSKSQDLSNIYGKVLRINPDGSVPTDNPYYDPANPNALKGKIYATGLRNPFRGGVTADGQLLIGDVGQNTWEEINLVSAGANFGWPAAEGVCPGPGECKTGSDGTTKPIYAYQHGDDNGSSITSVLVYDGDGFGEQYDNAIFFADHNQQRVKVMECDTGYTSCGTPITVIPKAGGTTRLAQGPDGDIYQLTLDGTLWRITPSSAESTTV
jgi:aldose sugar dehydrogenase